MVRRDVGPQKCSCELMTFGVSVGKTETPTILLHILTVHTLCKKHAIEFCVLYLTGVFISVYSNVIDASHVIYCFISFHSLLFLHSQIWIFQKKVTSWTVSLL